MANLKSFAYVVGKIKFYIFHDHFMILWPSRFTFWNTERFDSCAIFIWKWQMTKLHCKWLDSALGACSGDDGRYWLGIGSFQTRCFPILSCMSLGRPFDQDRFEEAWWIPSHSSFVFHVSKDVKETRKDLKQKREALYGRDLFHPVSNYLGWWFCKGSSATGVCYGFRVFRAKGPRITS